MISSCRYGRSFLYKADWDLGQIKANISKKRDTNDVINNNDKGYSQIRPKQGSMRIRRPSVIKVRGFYKNLNAMIERMLKSVEKQRTESGEARQEFLEDDLGHGGDERRIEG